MSYDTEQLRRIIEGAILAAGEALSVDKLHSLFEEHEAPEKSEIKAILESIAESCEGRGFQLVEVASGWRFQVREDIATWVNRLWEEKPQKYSRAMLETLALIAYRQPITRGDIEDVRGVAVSSHIIKTLVEREWVKVVGHRDVPGKPSLYATTRQFLDYFNLKSLDELPSLSELKDIDSINGSLDLDESTADEDSEPSEADAGASSENAPGSDAGDALEQEALQVSVLQDSAAELLAQAETVESGLDVDNEVEFEESDEEAAEDTLAGDSLIQAGEERVPVEEVDIPLALDDDALTGADANPAIQAAPTLEQEAIESGEPSADEEPSANGEPSADEEPSADKEPSANEDHPDQPPVAPKPAATDTDNEESPSEADHDKG